MNVRHPNSLVENGVDLWRSWSAQHILRRSLNATSNDTASPANMSGVLRLLGAHAIALRTPCKLVRTTSVTDAALVARLRCCLGVFARRRARSAPAHLLP